MTDEHLEIEENLEPELEVVESGTTETVSRESDFYDDPSQDVVTTVKPEEEEAAAEEEPAEVEAEVEAEQEAAAEEEPVEDPEAEPDKPKTRYQKRIDQLTRTAKDKEREADYWQGVAEGRIKPPSETEAEEQPALETLPKPDKPKIEDFETNEDYLGALTDWKFELKEIEQKEAAQTRAVEANQEAEDANREKIKEVGSAKYDDYVEVAWDDALPISYPMFQALQGMDPDLAVEVSYHLGKDKNECTRISQLPPVQAVRELGLLEARFKDGNPPPKPATREKKVAKTKTEAPDPIVPVSTTTTGDLMLKDPNSMSMSEYKEWRRQGGGK